MWRGVFHNKRKNGTLYWASTLISPINGENGEITNYLGISEDITDRLSAEHDLAQVQRMESLGNLAGGIAHDFNNMLLPILALSKKTMNELPRKGAARERMEKVVQAAERARDLVARILAFSRNDDPSLSKIDVFDNISTAMDLVRSTLPTSIEIVDKLEPNIGFINADGSLIQTVLLNLASNSTDAMNGHVGTLTVSLSRIEVDQELADRVTNLMVGPYAHLSVEDTGSGMDQETLKRIFDPFYTEKEVGEGTGLGLSMVHGIISRHLGAISVTSEPGTGTRFDIYLPLLEEEKAGNTRNNHDRELVQ